MSALRGKCPDCGHVFVVAHLPMPVAKVADLARRAACPKCGTAKGIKVASSEDGE